jgi:hypothetical protein
MVMRVGRALPLSDTPHSYRKSKFRFSISVLTPREGAASSEWPYGPYRRYNKTQYINIERPPARASGGADIRKLISGPFCTIGIRRGT